MGSSSRMPWARLLLCLAVLPGLGRSLTCYICGDTNLEEFGECSTQFQYDCGSYAARFEAQERIFCRTTRHRARNNTFTVMKECISEQDHYRTFPEKGYQLDEECDLVDIQNEEVAYCLCRNDLCNKQPIAEQFMTFEQKHPELFGEVDVTAQKPAAHAVPTGQAPLKIAPISALPNANLLSSQTAANSPAFAAPMLNQPAIVPVNDPRAASSSIETEIRRAQLPHRGVESEIASLPQSPSSKETLLLNLPHRTSTNQESVNGGSSQVVARPAPPPHAAPVEPRRGSPIAVMMHCTQCGDSNLHGEAEDCRRQVQIDCLHERSMCFTRQISLGNGMFALEKMCVLPEQLVAEFGEKAREEGCGSSNGGRVQYCACTNPSCNRLSLLQQRQLFTTVEAPAGKRLPELASPEVPQPMPPAFPTADEVREQAVVGPSAITEQRLPPTVITAPPPPPMTTPLPPAPQPIVPLNRIPPTMMCATCSEQLVDPTADCSRAFPVDCAAPDDQPTFCLTKQRQISNTEFAMEKRCVSEAQVREVLPREKALEGCATAQNGMVNYCLCKDSMCNSQSLLHQAQLSGVRDSLQQQRELEEQMKHEEMMKLRANAVHTKANGDDNSHRPPPVFLDDNDGAEEQNAFKGEEKTVAKDSKTEDEELQLRERQREWAHSDLNTACSLAPPLLLGILQLLFMRFN